MQRRLFCKSAIAVAVTSSLSACGARQQAGDPGPTIPAVSLDSEELSIESAAIEELRGGLDGRLYLQGDDGYESAKLVWNGMFDDKKPAVVVQCASTSDVVDAVNFSRERRLLVSVKCGGHSFPGKSTSDGGLMIDLSQMHSVDVDTAAMTARVDGGALLGHVDGATLPHELVTTTGTVSHTGVGGFTLGGGMGRTDRLTGLAVDNLLAATVVTADGEVVRASADENPDLLWGLRGGGGNFGVVTEFVYQLHPFNPTVYAGDLIFPADADTLKLYAEILEDSPWEANVEPFFVPSPDGGIVNMLGVTWSGDHAKGEKALAKLANHPALLSGELGPRSYMDIQTQWDGLTAHGMQNYLKSGYFDELTPDAIEIIVDYVNRGETGCWFQHLGGKTTTVARDATAFPRRNMVANFGIGYTSADPSLNEAGIAAVREFYYELEPYFAGSYENLHQEDSERQVWSNYGQNYGRLVELKNKYDPMNLFRLNANVEPTV